MKMLVVIAAALGLGTAAMASGPVTPPYEPPAMVPVAPAFSWAGGYAGLGLTYGRGGMDDAVVPPDNPDTSGPGLGLIAGYNWQNGNMVYGAEVALDFARRSGNNDCGVGGGFTCDSYQYNNASIRGRVGVAMDHTLLFVTAGYATDARRIRHSFGGVPFFNAGGRFNGPVVGIGIERAVRDNWSIRGDLEHYFLGSQTFGPYLIDGDMTLVRLTLVRRY